MAEASDNQRKNKGSANLRPWPKGVSGNPNGRPKKKGSIIELLEKMIEEQPLPSSDKTYKELIVSTWLTTVIDKKDKGRIQALKEMLDRLYGKPKESVEVSGSSDKPVTIKVVYDNGDKD